MVEAPYLPHAPLTETLPSFRLLSCSCKKGFCLQGEEMMKCPFVFALIMLCIMTYLQAGESLTLGDPSFVVASAHPSSLSGSPVYPSWQTQMVSGSPPPSPLISCRHSARGPHSVSWQGDDGDSSWRTTRTQQLLSSTGLSTQSTESPQVPRRCNGEVQRSEQLTLPVSSHSHA